MQKLVPGNSALAIFPPNAASLAIDKWRCVYDPNHMKIPPHITVAYPPFITEKQWVLKQKEIATCLRAFEPFTVTLLELGCFEGEVNVLWLKPEDDGNLQRVHSALQERFPENVPSSQLGYVPHVTVGFFESERALHQAEDAIKTEWEMVRFRVDEVVYAVLGDDGVWHIKDKLHLGGN